MKRFFFGLIAALSMTGMASAADVTRRAPASERYAPPVPFSWTGFYVGANIGGGWNSSCGSVKPEYTGLTGAIYNEFPFCSNDGFFLGGLQGGFNWQFGSLVAGVETDVTFGTNKNNVQTGTVTSGGGAGAMPNGIYTITGNGNPNIYGTLRARLGISVTRALFYITGGAAFGSGLGDFAIRYAGTPTAATTATWTSSGKDNGVGWTLGGGLEYAFTDHWTARIEYLYVSTHKNTTFAGVPCVGASCVNFPSDFHWNGSRNGGENVLRLGVNYKFGADAPAPVVARY